jgi:hypothetical protein
MSELALSNIPSHHIGFFQISSTQSRMRISNTVKTIDERQLDRTHNRVVFRVLSAFSAALSLTAFNRGILWSTLAFDGWQFNSGASGKAPLR